MQKTIFAILTSEQWRSREVIKLSLDREFAVGAPWAPRTHFNPLSQAQTEDCLSEKPEKRGKVAIATSTRFEGLQLNKTGLRGEGVWG